MPVEEALMAGRRPWVAWWRSHEFEHNGRGGARYGTRERAIQRARREDADGNWDVEVWWWPVIDHPETDPMPFKVDWRE